ncbi:hypothetical protein AVEN_115468-1 [Araneus ventricosus]|uniref:Uncharacterized protein n=1 Tax=Araneus ventricosus TaxID=182803 RepID=A0A4Y2K1R0_ARAVE|nr:hypothetical protein AVEN_115468-1 [Araneus ventricosus]
MRNQIFRNPHSPKAISREVNVTRGISGRLGLERTEGRSNRDESGFRRKSFFGLGHNLIGSSLPGKRLGPPLSIRYVALFPYGKDRGEYLISSLRDHWLKSSLGCNFHVSVPPPLEQC